MKNVNLYNKKRIAKNTLFLFSRSIITLLIALYTSRKVLYYLGVADFGIYNVVGSVVVLFSFIQNALQRSTERFLAFDIGKGDIENLRISFSLSLYIHFIFGFLIFLTYFGGLWFVNNVIELPIDRIEAAKFVLLFSTLSASVIVFKTPFLALITAYEKMNIVAYLGIFNALLNLVVALSLGFIHSDKLRLYALFLFIVVIIISLFCVYYCFKNFKDVRFKFVWDKKKFFERISFNDYEFLSGLSHMLSIQGGNILLNKFHGVLLNASNGIAMQVNTAANKFTNDFMIATTPQITKLYSIGDIEKFHKLINNSCKFCLLLSLLFVIPLILQMDFALNIWLNDVPDYTAVFCQLILIYTLLLIFFEPIKKGILATGNIRKFRVIDNTVTLCSLPLMYFGLKHTPLMIYLSLIITMTIRIFLSLLSLKSLTGFSISFFLKENLLRCIVVVVVSVPIPLIISFKMKDYLGFIICFLSFIVIYVLSSLIFGLTRNERNYIFNYLRTKKIFSQRWIKSKI